MPVPAAAKTSATTRAQSAGSGCVSHVGHILAAADSVGSAIVGDAVGVAPLARKADDGVVLLPQPAITAADTRSAARAAADGNSERRRPNDI